MSRRRSVFWVGVVFVAGLCRAGEVAPGADNFVETEIPKELRGAADRAFAAGKTVFIWTEKKSYEADAVQVLCSVAPAAKAKGFDPKKAGTRFRFTYATKQGQRMPFVNVQNELIGRCFSPGRFFGKGRATIDFVKAIEGDPRKAISISNEVSIELVFDKSGEGIRK